MNEYEKAKPTELENRLNQVTDLHERAREEFSSKDSMQLYERLLELCRGFIERGENIEEMTRQRVKRRQRPDSPLKMMGQELPEEFEDLLKYIILGKDTLANLRDHLYLSFTYPPATPLQALDQDYWNEFEKIMDLWQRNFSGVFFMRATMEVAVVATEMRWASKRMKSAYELSLKKKSIPALEVEPKETGKQ